MPAPVRITALLLTTAGIVLAAGALRAQSERDIANPDIRALLREVRMLMQQDIAMCGQTQSAAAAAITQAQAAVRLSVELKDGEAETIARRALADAQAFRVRTDAGCERRRADERVVARAADRAPSDLQGAGLTLASQGQVVVVSGDRTVPLTPSTVLKPGDRIRLGPNSTARYVEFTHKGTQYWLGENTEIVVAPPPRPEPGLREILVELRQGRFAAAAHAINRVLAQTQRREWRMASCRRTRGCGVMTIRGTEFAVEQDLAGFNRVTVVDGEVDVEDHVPAGTLAAWWRPAPAPPALVRDAPARVVAIEGSARIERAGTATPAQPGTALRAGETVVADGPSMTLDLADGHRIALARGARLLVVAAPGGAPVFSLNAGRAHVWGTGNETAVRFLTPGSVTVPRAREFEIAVLAGGVPEFVVLDGRIVVTAVKSRLDLSKLDLWWER